MEIMKRMWRHREIKLSLLTCVVFLVARVSSSLVEEDLTLQVNTRKPLSVCDDKFLSLVIDPLAILTSKDVAENYEKSIKLAKALSPAYLRLGGPQSNTYLLGDHNDTNYIFSEENWIRLHRWAMRTGLDVVSCISARFMENDNKVDLVSLTDRLGFNASWQLGYECQTRCDLDGSDVGKYVRILRDKLNTIPRYSNSIIVGPDVVAYGTKEQREYLENFFREADDALTAVTWHPDFASVTRNDGGIFMHHDRLSSEKNDLYRVIGRDAAKKPLWISESRPEASKNKFLGALVWTNRLGNAAKLGVQVLMRQPSDLAKPTPDYWVSLLHKKLVGQEVFDSRIQTGNRSHVHFYVQCTKASTIYERGTLTIFGVNLTPTKIRANVRGLKLRTLHEYVLMPGFDASNRMFSESVLLNGKPLNLINDTELPDMEAVTLNDEKGLSIELPSGGIGFWVVPDQKIRSCMDHYSGKGEEEADIEHDPTDQKSSQNEENKRVEDNEIRRKRRLIDHQKTSVRQENRKRKSIEKKEGEGGERKLKKIDGQKELEKLGKILKRRYARRENKKATSNGGSLDLFDFNLARETNGDELKEENTEKRSKRDLDKFLTESRRTDKKYKRKDETRRNEQPWTILGSKKGDSNENNFYGFFRQEPMQNFPDGDVFLATGDSKEQEEKDYDYVKDEDEVKKEEERQKLPQAMKIRTIDHAEPDDTWVDVGDDYRGYIPNEFYETINVPNVGERKEPVNDYADIWEAETIRKHSVVEENDEKDATEGKTTPESDSSIAEERRIKGNSVNMLMNHYANSPLGESNHEDLEEFPRGKAPRSRDSIVASPPDKTKLTMYGRRRAKTIPLENDELFSKSISASMPMQIPNYDDSSKHGKRLKRKIKDLNMILEREMIDEDNGNSKDCRCRVIRKLNGNTELGYSRMRRSVNNNEERDVEFREENYETDQPAGSVEQNLNHGDDEIGETSATITEISESSQNHQDILESNNSKIYESELETNEDQFFRRQREQPEETTTAIDIDENHNMDNSRISQATTPTPEENYSTTIPNIVIPEKTETIKISSLENSETSSTNTKRTTKVLNSVENIEPKTTLKREVFTSKITKRAENDRPNKSMRSPKETSKGSKKFLSKSANSSKTKIQSNSKASEAVRAFDSRLTSRDEALSTLKRESEERRKNVVGSISNEKHRDHRQERTEKLESLRRRLLAKREEILKQYEDELLDAMKRSDINEEEKRKRNKNTRNLKREIWEKLRSTDEYRDMLDREKVAYVLTYSPINYDLVETEKEKPVKEERKYIPVVEITRPVYRVEEKLIDQPAANAHRHLQDPRVMLYAKSDGSNSRVIQSRFPYDIIGERERYGSLDQVASGKRYYALVDSSEEDPWMFQYQRRSKENQRNVYESGGRKEKQLAESMRTYGTPIKLIYEDFEETIDSDETSNSQSTERKIYAIDPSTYKGGEPELEIHQDSVESLVNNRKNDNIKPIVEIYNEDDDNIKPVVEVYDENDSNIKPVEEVYSVILKPQFGATAKNYQAQKNAPILYTLDANRQNDPKKQSSVLTYVLGRRHANDNTEKKSDVENNFTATEADITGSVETLESQVNGTAEVEIVPKEKLEDIEQTSKIDSNEEEGNVESHRTRRAIEGTDSGLLKQMPLFFVRKTPYEESKTRSDYLFLNNDQEIERSAQSTERFSKLLKRLDTFESMQHDLKKNMMTSDRFFSKNGRFDDFNDDLSKNIILLPKINDLSKNSEQELHDNNQYKSQEHVPSTNEREDNKSLKQMNYESMKNEKFNGNEVGRRWLKLLPVTMGKLQRERRQFEDPLNWNDDELHSLHPNEIFRSTSKFSKNPKLTSKQVYKYMKENGGNLWNNPQDLNKETELSNDIWEFKPLSIQEEEGNYADNILKDLSQRNSVINTNDRKDGPENNNKSSSFLQGTLPKLQEVITEGFDKAQNLTESLEQFVESFEKKFNETLQKDVENKNGTLNKNTTYSATNDIFRTAITNVKKFFAFLGGVSRIFYV